MAREPRSTRTQDDGSAHRYFAMIPHTITRGKRGRGLSLPARWLYVYLKSVTGESGVCDKSTTAIVKEAQLGRGTIGPAKEELMRAGLITLSRREGKYHATDLIHLIDLWPENMQEFKGQGSTPDEQPGCTPPEQQTGCTPPEQQTGCTTDEQPASSTNSMQSLSDCTPDEQPGCTPPVLGCTPGVPKKKDLKNKPQDLNTPPLPPTGGQNDGGGKEANPTAALFDREAQLQTQVVVTHLNTVTGMDYRHPGHITERLHEGATAEECCQVIDWLYCCRGQNNPRWVEEYLDTDTPFKAEYFDKFRAKAAAWHKGGRKPPKTHQTQVTDEQEVINRLGKHGAQTYQNSQRMREEAPDAHGHLPEGRLLPRLSDDE